jgi:peptidyl-tRNA hydrolase, PTH1 family
LRAIVGLGNPGKRYEFTRHNVGFLVTEKFAEKYNLGFKPSTADYVYSNGVIDETSEFILLKPTTYMNMSGIALKSFLDQSSIKIDDIIVIYDDINLEVGRIRPRKSGNDGGHNGIASLINQLQSDQFPRIRFGIGNKFEKGRMVEFVLQKFSETELRLIEPQISSAIDLLEQFIRGGVQFMLDYYSKISNAGNNQTLSANGTAI